jgi:hypothetical protein
VLSSSLWKGLVYSPCSTGLLSWRGLLRSGSELSKFRSYHTRVVFATTPRPEVFEKGCVCQLVLGST